MTYQGYMALANDEGETIELVNAARVKAYTDNLAPSLGLRGCDDCEGLDDALGETYTNPTADVAPWYDPTDPDTAGFYGVYPLEFQGIDDSTRTIESAELTGDGSVVVGSRFTGKDIRVSGVAFAADEASLYAGVSWLDNALNGTEEGRCFGDRLNLYSSCPDVEVLPEGFATPYTLVNPPSAAELAAWTTTSGPITGDADGIQFLWDLGDPQKVACRQITGLIPGEQYQLRSRLENFGHYFVRVSDSCSSQRINLFQNPRLLGQPFTGAGITDVESDQATGGPLGLGYRQSITTTTNSSSPYAVVTPAEDAVTVTARSLYQVSVYVFGRNSTARLAVQFYDASDVAVGGEEILISGVSMNQTWIRLDGIVEAPTNAVTMRPAVRFSASVGAIPAGSTFGVANLLVEEPNYEITRTSLSSDPRAQTDTTNWGVALGTGGAATSVFVTGAGDGPVLYGSTQSTTYRRHTFTTAPSGGNAGPNTLESSTLNFPDPLPAGTPWTAGAFFRSNRTVSGTVIYRIRDSATAVLQEVSEAFTLNAGVWTYLAANAVTPASLADATSMIIMVRVGGTGGGAAVQVGDIYEATGSLFSIDTQIETYFDSDRPTETNVAFLAYLFPDSTTGAIRVLADAVGTYFDGYTDGFEWDGPADDSTSSTDEEIDYQTIVGWERSHEPPTEPTVLDFIPRTSSVYVSITPTPNTPTIPTLDLEVQDMSVIRVPRPGVITFGSGDDAVAPSDGWTHLAPAGMAVTWDLRTTSTYTDARLPSGGSASYLATHGVERTLFGLQIGSRYRLMIEFNTSWDATDVAATASLTPIIEISNSDGYLETYNDDNVGTFQYFRVVEFTATATSAVLFLHPTSTLVLGTFGTVRWEFNEYMVEEILEADATPPQPGRFQERTMYEVKASSGPTVTNVRTSPCGVMAQITYSLRAGNPFKYRSPIFAGGLPSGTSETVGEVLCSDGLPQIINFYYNPSVETNASGWGASGTGITTTRSASASAIVGGFVFRSTAPNTPGNSLDSFAVTYNTATAVTGPIPQPGETLTVSMYLRAITSDSLVQTGVYPYTINVTMSGFPPIVITGSIDVVSGNTWYRIEETFTLPLNVALTQILMTVQTPTTYTQGGGIDADGFMIQRGSVATTIFDETDPNAEWSGTPDESALLLNQVQADIASDPDCPVPPDPPGPPTITNSCVAAPATYTRTVVSISDDTVPRNLTAYPVITLVAGSADVRQARIRFFENPDGLTIDELNPCSFEGEIIVSYLAAGATMVIDGVLHEATVTLPGFDPQNANHVLYGADGGPVDWPELSGGIPYLVTLELDSSAPYTDTLMTIDLVVRD